MGPLKILLVSEYFPPDVKGGGELSAELLARNLAVGGHEVHVLTSGPGTTSDSEGLVVHRTLRTAPHTSILGNFRRMLILPRQISGEVRRLQAEHNFNVIHYLNVVSLLGSLPNMKNQFATLNSHQPFCPKANLFYKEREPCTGCNPLKFVGCLAHSEYVGKTRISGPLRLNPLFPILLYNNYLRFRAALKKVQPIAVSSYVSEQLASIGFPDAPIIPTFPLRRSVKKKKTPRKQEDKVTILFLGALEKIKGAGLLLQAHAALPQKERLQTKLQIAGSGSLQEELGRQAPRGVEFLGQISSQRAQQMIAQCDIVVLPSLWPEPLSRVLLEAASFGKAVVATDVGGNADVVTPETGCLAEPNAGALAQCLEELILDPEKRKRLGKALQKRYNEQFSSRKILLKLDSLYQRN